MFDKVDIPDTVKLAAAIVSVAAIPVNADPSPLNEVPVITPTALIPPARTLIPVLAVTIPSESTLVTSS